MPIFQNPPLHLHYTRTAPPDGRAPVLFLHGLGSSAADWALQVPAFTPQHRLIALDLRAHGQSSDPGDWFTVEMLAEDVAALLADLDEPPAHVVGLSLGGCVALALALRPHAPVRTLTLVNTFAKYVPAGQRSTLRQARRMWLVLTAPMPKLAAYIAGGLFPRPEQKPLYEAAVASLSHNRRRAYMAAMRAIAAFDVRAQLPTLRVPTLIITGEHDATVGRAAQDVLRASIPNARWELIAHSGHATPYDQSEVFNQLVLEFVAGQ